MGWLKSLGGIAGGVLGNAILPGVGGAIGTALGSSLGGSDGGGGGGGTAGGNAPPVYVPKDQQGADTNFNSNKAEYETWLRNQQQQLNPYNQQLLQSQFSNPYANIAQANSNQAGQDYEQLGKNATVAGGQAWNYANQQLNNANQSNALYQAGLGNVQHSTDALYGMAGQSNQNYQGLMDYQKGQLGNIQQSQGNLYGSGNQVLNTAFDPQNALYNQQQQLNTDQSRASEYARGIQSSPYGAALENQSNQNFNLNWQNQQLARQTQGLQAAQGAYGSAQGMGNSYTGAQAGLQAGQNEQYAGLTNAATSQYSNYLSAMNQSNLANSQNLAGAQQNAFALQNQGAQSAVNAGQAPYNTFQQVYGNQNQALQNFAGNNQNYLQGLNQLQSNDLGYMNFAQGAQNQGFNQNAFNNQQQQQAISSIAGPLSNGLQNTNWANVGNTVKGWFNGSSGDDYSNYGDASFY